MIKMKKFSAFVLMLSLWSAHLSAGNVDSEDVTDPCRRSAALTIAGVRAYLDGNGKQAAEYFDKAIKEDPFNDAAYYYRGCMELNDKKVMMGIDDMTKAQSLDSTNIWYARYLAKVYMLLERNPDALRQAEKVNALRPGDPEAMMMLADVYSANGNYAAADSLYTRVLQITGNNEAVIVSRIEMYRGRGLFKEFFAALDEYFRSPSSSLAASEKTQYISRLINGSDPRFNAAHLSDYNSLVEGCLRTHPSDTAVIHYAASFFYGSQNPEKLDSLCALNPDDVCLIRFSVFSRFGRKDYEGTVAACDNLLRLCGGDRNDEHLAHAVKADCCQATGRQEQAFREYEAALAIDGDDIVVLNNYAYYMSCLGRNLSKCEKMSRRVIKAEPENPTYLDTYAWILFKQKKFKASKVVFKKALMYGGKESHEILYHYSEVLDALGEHDAADGYRQMAGLKEDEGK